MEKFVRDGFDDATFFVGPEIEHTTAFGKKTLFVRGLQDTALVERLAREHKAPHIFIGVSRSFDSLELRDDVYMVGDTLASDWDKQIHDLLDAGFMVTLDYPAHKHYDVLKVLNPGVWQSRNFIPMLAVPVPNIQTSSVNLTIKIDDSNFAETNPGVWCLNHHEVTDSNRFTDWRDYGDDMILTAEDIAPVVTPGPTGWAGSVKVPVAATTNKVVLTVADTIEVAATTSVSLNQPELGLDTESISALKPDTEGTDEIAQPTVKTVEAAAEAYADNAPEVTEKVSKTKKSKTL
jgi:hypothetical protein